MDLGCGTCILKDFLPNFKSYYAVDLSLNMLKIAKARYENLNLIQADVENLPFKAGIFKTITIITVIQNLLSLEKLFLEIDRISKKSRQIFISILKKDKLLSKFDEFITKSPYKLMEKIEKREIEDILYYIKK